MEWFHYFLAALQTLSALAPAVVSEFHGGAANTGAKVVSALAVANRITTQLGQGISPDLTGVDIHPALADHAASVATQEQYTTGATPRA